MEIFQARKARNARKARRKEAWGIEKNSRQLAASSMQKTEDRRSLDTKD